MKPHPDLSNNEVLIDREQAFLLFSANCGDVEKTAHALGISSVVLLRVVDQEGWLTRLGPILEKMKSQRPGDVERSINRSLNFCIAHRFRILLMRALRVMENWSDEELREAMESESTSKAGKTSYRVSTRWTADFSASLEKMAAMSYAATNDSTGERVRRNDAETSGPVQDLHSLISLAMSGVGESKTPRAMLLDSQLEVASDVAKQAVIPKPVVDDTYTPDEH